jgi:hypothetical protein
MITEGSTILIGDLSNYKDGFKSNKERQNGEHKNLTACNCTGLGNRILAKQRCKLGPGFSAKPNFVLPSTFSFLNLSRV